jgi:hypothetical protein
VFEPHDDKRELQTRRSGGWVGGVFGFALGFTVGWLAWDRLVLPLLRGRPTPENPAGDPTELIYYGTLVLCVGASLFIVAVASERLGRRRANSRRS